MADGARPDPRDDDVERVALTAEARLLSRVRRRLVAWSGMSTLVVLLVLGAALYAAVANTLAAASVSQLESRVDPVAAFLEGGDAAPGRGPDPGGFLFGGGNTLLYLFDAAGTQVQLGARGGQAPAGLPDQAGIAAAAASPDGQDVRTAALQIEFRRLAADVPVRILTQRVVAQVDGNVYYLQALQDRSTEAETLAALLAVLVIGGVLVVLVAVGFGTVYARRALVPIRESLDAQRTALRRQREFAADASHELRTPLTVIRASAEHLARNGDRPVRESQEALDDIEAEVGHLTSLVEDLLLLARSDSGSVQLERMLLDLGDVASDAVSAVGRAAESRGVLVRVDPEPAMVVGDAARLRQLVLILADNAIRHSPRGAQVDVTVRRQGTIAWLEVADQGPGVRQEDMPHVFERFWRAPGAPSGGTGLGLAIARWIAERHGGRVGVANRASGGAVFHVELPAAPGGPPPAPPLQAPGATAGD